MSTTTKVALVTGAGSGVGRYAALALLNDGYSVVLAGRRADALDETIRMSTQSNASSLAVPTDVTDPKAVNILFKSTKDRFGKLNLLFNNAGVAANAQAHGCLRTSGVAHVNVTLVGGEMLP